MCVFMCVCVCVCHTYLAPDGSLVCEVLRPYPVSHL